MVLICALLLSYLLGSLPTAYLFGRILKGVDIRKYGSGNIGATNAFRLLGPYIGILVLLIDITKGVIPVVFIGDFALNRGVGLEAITLKVILGILAVLGHSFTIFLNFRGGKGLATTLGVLVGLTIALPALRIILLLELGLWLTVFCLWRIVSLASLVCTILFPLFFLFFRQSLPLILMSLGLSILVILRHKSNIYRLLRKQEPRLNFKK